MHLVQTMFKEMNGGLGHLCAHNRLSWARRIPEDGEGNKVTFANTRKYGEGSYITLFPPSDVTAFHRILNFHERANKEVFAFKPECQSEGRIRDLRLFNQAALTTTPGCYITLFSPSDVSAFHRILNFHERANKDVFVFKPECQSEGRTRDRRLFNQAAPYNQ